MPSRVTTCRSTLVTTGTGPVLPPDSLVGRVRRPRLPGGGRARERLCRGRRVPPAVGPRELLAHDHGSVARRHAGDRERARRGRAVALRAVWCRTAVRDARGARPRASTSWRSDRRRHAASPQGGRDYVLAHYSPDDVLDRVEATLHEWTRREPRPHGHAVRALPRRHRRVRRAAGEGVAPRRRRRRGALAGALRRTPVARPAQSSRSDRRSRGESAGSTGSSSSTTPTSSSASASRREITR